MTRVNIWSYNNERVCIHSIQLSDGTVIELLDGKIQNENDMKMIYFKRLEQIQVLHFLYNDEIKDAEFNYMNYGLVKEYCTDDDGSFSITYTPIE